MPLRRKRTCAPTFICIPVGNPFQRFSARKSYRRPGPRCLVPSVSGWAALAISCGIGLISQRTRQIPDALRGAPSSFLAAASLRSLIGTALQPACDTVLAHAPAGVALLLLTAASDRVSSDKRHSNGGMTIAFAIGAVGSVSGAALGAMMLALLVPAGHVFHLVPNIAVPLAGAFAATYIGGSLNFIAVVAATGIGRSAPHAVAAALSADLLLMTAYFGALFALASRIRCGKLGSTLCVQVQPLPLITIPSNSRGVSALSQTLSMSNNVIGRAVISCAMPTLSWMVFGLARFVVNTFALGPGADVLLVTALALPIRSKVVGKVLKNGTQIADFSLLLFFASLGGCVTVGDIGAGGLPVALLCCITLFVHALFMFLVWKMTNVEPEVCLVASNANIGGPTTAAAFAAAEEWNALVGPAAFVGAVGYAVATPIALLLSYFLRMVL